MATSTVRVLFLGDATSATRATGQLDKSLGGINRTASLLGKTLAVGIVGGLVAATKAAVDFDRSMRNVNAISKLSEARFQALSKQVLGLSKETGKAPRDLARGLYDIVSSGFQANDAIKILRVSAKAATAGLTDTATATKAINAALNAYHLQAEDARKVSDILFQTVNKGVLTFEELAQNMGDLVPAAAPLGVTLEEVGAAIATITLQGVPAAEAATRVKNTMLQLASPSKDLSKLLKENGFASGEAAIKANGFVGVLQLLQKTTGGSVTETAKLTPEIRSLLGVVGLTGKNLQTYEANLRSMDTAQRGSGASAKAFAEQGKSIGVQWDRAKASLIAAAIPLGQQLFPLLSAGAGKVEQFAEALPRLQQQLSPLGAALREVGSALQFVGSHPEGQAAIIGIISALGAAKIAVSLRNLALGIGGVASPAGLAAAAVGLLAGGLFYTATRSDQLARSLENLKGALAEQASAEEQVSRSRLRAAQTVTQAKAAEMELGRARREASAILREYGRDSEQYRGAALRVEQAEQSVKQSHLDRKTAAKDVQRAEQTLADSSSASATATRAAYDKATAALKRAEASYFSAGQSAKEFERNQQPIIAILREFAVAIRAADRAAGNAVGSTKAYQAAVLALNAALGRLPSVKEIRIYVRQIGSIGGQTSGPRPPGAAPRASGGFIPHVPGSVSGVDSVPAILTPGEIVLNRGQQETLGGPRFLAQLFGFSGERGTHFQAGGIVPRGAGGRGGARVPTRRRYPHRSPRQRPYSKVTAAARFAFRAAERVGSRISDLDRSYGQLQREFSISPEEPILFDEDGNEILNSAAISKHLNEIGRLIQHRQRMLALLDEEKAKLEEAIEALRKAVAELMAEMNRERQAAEADARQAREFAQALKVAEREEADLRDQKPKTTKARKERDAAVRRSEREQDRLRGRIEGARKSEQKHLNRRRGLSTLKGDLASNIETARALMHDVPFDRRDVNLDVMELMQEAREWSDIRAQPGFGGGGEDGGRGGEEGGGGGGTGGIDEEALRRLGLGRLAAAVEIAQLKVIGQFHRGTIHVPQTAAYLLEAGERVVPRGVPNVTAEAGPVFVQISSNDSLLGELLSRAIDVGVARNADALNQRIGTDADRRRREGRYA